jgi:hypothetical protein
MLSFVGGFTWLTKHEQGNQASAVDIFNGAGKSQEGEEKKGINSLYQKLERRRKGNRV